MAAYGELARARTSCGATQATVAKRIGISRSQFSRVENGHDTVTADQLFAWAAAVGCEVIVRKRAHDGESGHG